MNLLIMNLEALPKKKWGFWFINFHYIHYWSSIMQIVEDSSWKSGIITHGGGLLDWKIISDIVP